MSTQQLKIGSTRESELWRRIQNVTFEDQIALEDVSSAELLRLLDCNAYFDLLDIPRPGSEETMIHYLEQDSLVETQDDGLFSITNLGAIALAQDFSSFPSIKRKALRVIRYEGKSRSGRRREREFAKGYAVDLEAAYDYIDGIIQPMEEIRGAKSVPRSAYPEIAVRELVVNALIHQDFTITGAGPMVEIFDDRMEITNPGVPLVDPERIVNDPPQSRNESLSALMRRFHFCEEAGSGWDKIVEGCEQYHLPAPRIETRQSMRVTLFQPKRYKDLTPEERLNACYWHACVSYERGEYVTNASLRERFDLSTSNSAQVSRLIKEAMEEKLIKPVNPNTSPRYMKYQPYWA